ncbi:MAG: AMP phosphorylase [Candidatus Woesearchaeota archaeon]
MDVATGGTLVAVLNENDAAELDLHLSDRIRLKRGRKETIAVVDFAESKKAVPRGRIGLFEEVLSKLNAKSGDEVSVFIGEKPESLWYIKKKLDGKELDYKDIKSIIDDTVSNSLTTVELAYYVAANYMGGMSTRETVALTKAMINTGDKLQFRGKVIDKHCIGGVAGNRTTPIVVPILAAAGLKVPKTSSRSITSPAGTADMMEVLTDVEISTKRIMRIVDKTNACLVWGGAVDLAPADDKIIKVEHPLSIDAPGQLLASIMAKKGSVSATHVIIDIPVGRDSKIESRKEALRLKRGFENLGKVLNMKVKVILTDGSQPVGRGMGPVLEAIDVLDVLKNNPEAPPDLRKKSLRMAGLLLEMTGKAGKGEGRGLAKRIVDSGDAYRKFMQIIMAQGAKETDEKNLKPGPYHFDVKADKKGKVANISNVAMSKIARIAGSPADKGSGIYLHKKKGDSVAKGEKIFTIYSKSSQKLKFALNVLEERDGFVIS